MRRGARRLAESVCHILACMLLSSQSGWRDCCSTDPAQRALEATGRLEGASITVLFNSDEEIGSLGSRSLIEQAGAPARCRVGV